MNVSNTSNKVVGFYVSGMQENKVNSAQSSKCHITAANIKGPECVRERDRLIEHSL